MKTIDIDSWPRRMQFETFGRFDYPHFNVTANIDVEGMLPIAREHPASLTVIITYLLARTANHFANFRWRIRGSEVIEHDVVHPSITILTPDDLFSFCTIDYSPDFATFATAAAAQIAHVREHPALEDAPYQDDLLYMTSIPWISFTSFMHPIHMHPVDSVPRIAWGKIHSLENRHQMPLSVQGHHALMDGLHVGQYFEHFQESCDNLSSLLDA